MTRWSRFRLHGGSPDEEDDGFGAFELLRNWSYEVGLFFQNSGDFVIGLELSEQDALRDLHHHVLDKAGGLYWDVVVFSDEDRDLLAQVSQAER